ncbi:MAG: hypothetical protein GYA36_16490, partial [Veillonellaceae bacterium]|nr:hypothetical protein [Veillonellaceae bacterium]
MKVEHCKKVEARFPWVRLGVLIGLMLVVYIASQFLHFYLSIILIVLAVLIFALVAVQHQRVIDQLKRMQNFAQLLSSQIARSKLNWEGIPAPSMVKVSTDHPFAADLNIVGDRSLHRLLDTTTSLGGSYCLSAWLLNPIPDPRIINERQQLVSDLVNLPAFRTRLELNGLLAGSDTSARWDGSALMRWLEAHMPVKSLLPKLLLLSVLAGVNIPLFVLNAFALIPAYWVLTLVIYLLLQSMKYRETSEVFDESYSLARQLQQLRLVFLDLETTHYPLGSMLSTLVSPFTSPTLRPSVALKRIGRIVSAASLRNNPFLSLALNILGPWDLYFAYQLERYKKDLRGCLPTWLETWYQIESLSALANFAALNPETTFPQILNYAPGNTVFSGCAVGHPLIHETSRVNNDFEIQNLGEINIITGSNMSGKSTFLRTIGINLVLAFAGSKVIARNLQVIPFRVFTSMNVTDSISDGISFFYAEVSRLRMLMLLVQAQDSFPLFYLIDEIFR